jgi:plastocyanin
MHPTGVASAAWVFASSAPSKVPFYVAGGALACWAVVLAASGLRAPAFPRSTGQMRAVMGTSIGLVAATVAMAIVTAGEEGRGEAAAAGGAAKGAATGAAKGAGGTVALDADPGGNLAYVQRSASVAAGKVTVRFTNKSPLPHNVTIAAGSKVLTATKTIQGTTATTTADLSPGRYVYYCSVPGHREAGMQGTLTVR